MSRVVTATKTVTSAGTAEALVSTAIKCSSVVIQAKRGNTNPVFVGDNNVDSSNGIELDAEETISLAANDSGRVPTLLQLDTIYIDVTTNGEGVNILYIV